MYEKQGQSWMKMNKIRHFLTKWAFFSSRHFLKKLHKRNQGIQGIKLPY